MVKTIFKYAYYIITSIIFWPYNWYVYRSNYKVIYESDPNWYENQFTSERAKESARHMWRTAMTPAKAKWEIMMFNRTVIAIFFWVLADDIYKVVMFSYSILFVKFPKYLDAIKRELINYYSVNVYAVIFLLFFIYLFNTTILSILSYFFGVRGVFVLSAISIILFWLTQIYFINEFFFESMTVVIHFDFLNYNIGVNAFTISLKIDFVSYCFLFLTTSIGVCAIIYSLNYFKNEPHTDRFILLLSWFILSMSLLVISDNALLLFLGWELIGLTSFLLINFWTLRRNTLKSAFKAFSFNKISDVFLLFFIVTMSHQVGSLSLTNWYTYYLLQYSYSVNYMFVPTVFLIIASSIKSAQIFGHLWLPDSMEAPIPASALIHSATLVSAGVYLLLRFNWALKVSNLFFFVAVLGAVTALYGAIVSAAQTDCKKLLAYSTISHCGFLFITIGLNNVYLTVTYLYLHGFFKALTFFCVGNLVKVSKGYQDTRKMGQLFVILPLESVLLVVCAFNLGALPFTVGYFYKALFQVILLSNTNYLILLPFTIVAMLSSIIYVFRLVFYSLFDIQKNNNINYDYFFKPEYEDEEYSNTTTFGILFIFLLLVLAYYVYIFYLLFFKNFIILNLTINNDFIEILNIVQKNVVGYYYFFYILFTTIFIFILRVECRYEFSYLKKNYSILTFLLLLASTQLLLLLLCLLHLFI